MSGSQSLPHSAGRCSSSQTRPPLELESFSDGTRVLLVKESSVEVSNYQQMLKQRIDALNAEVVALRRSHNATTFVHRLPPELLLKIFFQVQADCAQSDDQIDCGGKLPHAYDWFTLTHVCSRWRSVAIECPSLWTDVPIALPGFVSTIMARSKDMAMDVRSPANCIWKPSALKGLGEVLAHSSRLRVIQLDLQAPSEDLESSGMLLSWVDTPPGNMLEELSLSSSAMAIADSLPLIAKAPLLRKLTLCSSLSTGIPLDKILLGEALTHLILSCPSLDSQRPSMHTLLTVLQHSPRLEQLHLRGAIPSPLVTPDEPSQPVRPIQLHNLRDLRLQDVKCLLSEFFRMIRLPNVESMTIVFDTNLLLDWSEPTAGLCTLFSNLRRSTVATKSTTPFDNFRHLTFTDHLPVPEPLDDDDSDLGFEEVTNGLILRIDENPCASPKPSLVLNLEVVQDVLVDNSPRPSPSDLLIAFQTIFNLCPLESVTVENAGDAEFRPDVWNVLRRLPNLRHMIIHSSFSNLKDLEDIELFRLLHYTDGYLDTTVHWPMLSTVTFCSSSSVIPPYFLRSSAVPSSITWAFREWPQRPNMRVVFDGCVGLHNDHYQLMRRHLDWITFVGDGDSGEKEQKEKA